MVLTQVTISVAKDFSEFPFGRYPSDSPFCGEIFRDTRLLPALNSNDKVQVVLDGVKSGYGSSFLEESFGGLVRKRGFTPEQLRNKLTIVSVNDPRFVSRVWDYIDRGKSAAAG